jgi:glycosyltransferase involved in cell wall biosynthesis
MNILITAVSSSLGPSGICRHAYSLACCAVSREEVSRATLVIGKWQESYFQHSFRLQDAKLDIVVVDIPNNAFSRNRWYLRDLPGMANAVNADIIHLSFPAPIRRNKLRCPVVVSLHDLYPYDEPDNFGFPKVFFNRIFLQQCLREADLVACVSEATLSRLMIRFPRYAHRKGMVVHNCVNISPDESLCFLVEERPFFLMVAQHRANKNIPMALKVFKDLLCESKINRHTLLLLVGNHGPETLAIKSCIKRSALEENVKLVDGVSDQELRWLYKKCDLLLVPSLREGFGLPVVEGLLCGSRVVCSDIPALREIGGEACHYFDLHSEAGSTTLDATIRNALAEPARSSSELDRFSLQKIADDLAVIYQQLQRGALGLELMNRAMVAKATERSNPLGVGVQSIDL